MKISVATNTQTQDDLMADVQVAVVRTAQISEVALVETATEDTRMDFNRSLVNPFINNVPQEMLTRRRMMISNTHIDPANGATLYSVNPMFWFTQNANVVNLINKYRLLRMDFDLEIVIKSSPMVYGFFSCILGL